MLDAQEESELKTIFLQREKKMAKLLFFSHAVFPPTAVVFSRVLVSDFSVGEEEKRDQIFPRKALHTVRLFFFCFS